MFCKNCGAQQPDNSKFCTSCGSSIAAAQQPIQQPVQSAPQQQFSQAQQSQQQFSQPIVAQQMTQAGDGEATTSLICGIAGLVLCWIPIIGLILNILAIVFARKAKGKGSIGAKATIGMVLGIVAIVIVVFWTIITVVTCIGSLASTSW